MAKALTGNGLHGEVKIPMKWIAIVGGILLAVTLLAIGIAIGQGRNSAPSIKPQATQPAVQESPNELAQRYFGKDKPHAWNAKMEFTTDDLNRLAKQLQYFEQKGYTIDHWRFLTKSEAEALRASDLDALNFNFQDPDVQKVALVELTGYPINTGGWLMESKILMVTLLPKNGAGFRYCMKK